MVTPVESVIAIFMMSLGAFGGIWNGTSDTHHSFSGKVSSLDTLIVVYFDESTSDLCAIRWSQIKFFGILTSSTFTNGEKEQKAQTMKNTQKRDVPVIRCYS